MTDVKQIEYKGDGLIEALTQVKADIGAIGKDRRMSAGGDYQYRGIEDILDAAHDSLVRNHVLIVPVSAEPLYEARTTKTGNYMQWVSVRVTWQIHHPGGFIEAQTIGEATDSSDKATNKAHTAAFKVLLSEMFAIPFRADDPDHERVEVEPIPEVVYIKTRQVSEIMARIAQWPQALREAARPVVKGTGRKIEKIRADQYDEALAFLDLVEVQADEIIELMSLNG